MGNRCFKKKYESMTELDDYSLKQITISKIGNCNLCNKSSVEGYYTFSVIEDKSLFICLKCKT